MLKKALSYNNELFQLIGCVSLAVYWVIFIWNFWDKGIGALGGNVFIFLLLLLGLFVWVLHIRKMYSHRDLVWIVPIMLISLSYALYDNMFIKAINILVIPILFGVFYNQAFFVDKYTRVWDFDFIFALGRRFFSFFPKIISAMRAYAGLILLNEKTKKQLIIRVLTGVFIFIAIALTVFIPLLSSADELFATKVQVILEWSRQIISLPVMYKIIVVGIFSIVLYAVLSAWSLHFEIKNQKKEIKQADAIIAGIVLGGILCLYFLFLWVQVSRLWIGSLPFDFKETEDLVKSGFWQLFVLTGINTLIYFFVYRKTTTFVQKILVVFSITSLFLLASAGYRMGLYVLNYGLSYEKFFASYTIVFCTILFMWLIGRLFVHDRADIVKFVAVLFLWMYSLVTIVPVEAIIVKTNMALAERVDSRIRLFEMTMLSPDALLLLETYYQQGRLTETIGYLHDQQITDDTDEVFDWSPWIERQKQIINDKQWYEMNLMNVLYMQNKK